MLLLLSILFAAGGEPPTIVVSDTIDEEIYFQDPVVLCDDPCQFENDTSMIFVQANSKHRSWFKKGKKFGKGQFFFSGGGKYDGGFENDVFHGFGELEGRNNSCDNALRRSA